MFTRKKTFTLDGVELQISPLTALQVEEHLVQEAEIVEAYAKAKESGADLKPLVKRQEKLMLSLICGGLNNATPETKMTPERLLSEADPVLIGKLQSEIMEMSGLKMITPESPPGEG